VDVDIDDEDAGRCARGQSDVRVRGALPPGVDYAGDGGGVVEAVRRERLLAAGDAGEDRDAEVGITQRGGRERWLASDSLHR
jgi:hypothetical protein